MADHSRILMRAHEMDLATALAKCTELAQCNTLTFKSASPLSTQGASEVVFYSAAQLVDPNKFSTNWIYYKNSSQLPFCDLEVSQSFLSVHGNNSLHLSWEHCAGQTLHAELSMPDGNAVASVALEPSTRSSVSIDVPTISQSQVGQQWSLLLLSDMLSTPLQSFELPIENASCGEESGWPSTLAGVVAKRDCWEVDVSQYATGSVQRECSQSGEWLAEDLTECSSGGWGSEQLAFLNDPSIDQLQLVERSDQSLFTFLIYFPGDKIYSWRFGSFSADTACMLHQSVDVPGTMVNSSFRRMAVGELVAADLEDCGQWSIPLQLSLSTSAQESAYISDVASLHYDGASVAVDTDSQRFRVDLQMLPFHGIGVYRLTISDLHEDMCLENLNNVCADSLAGDSAQCTQCATLHSSSLAKTFCQDDDNWEDVVNFWCICAQDNSCGGPSPANNSSFTEKNLYAHDFDVQAVILI